MQVLLRLHNPLKYDSLGDSRSLSEEYFHPALLNFIFFAVLL